MAASTKNRNKSVQEETRTVMCTQHDYLPIQTCSQEVFQPEYPGVRWELNKPPSTHKKYDVSKTELRNCYIKKK
jgi:hypothetical protein